jgi:hypothetical protein
MSRTTMTRLSTAAALIAGAGLFATAAKALPPGAAPPWANQTTTTETTTTPATPSPAPIPAATPAVPAEQSPAAVPAAQTPQTTEPGTTTPIPVAVTPMQGTTTPRQAVSMRAGPNTGFPVIGTLRPGDQLQILATANYGWVQVASPQGTGWAYGSYLAPAGTVPDAQPPAPPPEVISR